MSKHVVIIGNGIAGTTCARHLRKKSNCRITIISAESEYFFSRTALMYVYMGHMKFEHTKPYEDFFWTKNKIDLVFKTVSYVEFDTHTIRCTDGVSYHYDELVIATGSQPNKFGWPGQDLNGVQSLYHLQDLELMEKNTKGIRSAVIAGGGLIGVEMAEMLRSRNIQVTFLVREKEFWDTVLPTDEARMIGRHIREHDVNLMLETELKEIKGNAEGNVVSVVTKTGDEIPCGFVGLTVGVSPNIGFLEGSGIATERGILVNEFLETNIPGVYAIGDCAQLIAPKPGRKAIEAVWYSGRMHGETLAETLSGNKTHFSPGHWFNSAKFFDIEYQTYGLVPPKTDEHHDSFYWEHASGKICFRANCKTSDGTLRGINAFGIRLRHEIIAQWLTEKRKMDYVIDHLSEANFDSEFSHHYEADIRVKFRKENHHVLSRSNKA